MFPTELRERQMKNISGQTELNKQKKKQLITIDKADIKILVRWKRRNCQLF